MSGAAKCARVSGLCGRIFEGGFSCRRLYCLRLADVRLRADSASVISALGLVVCMLLATSSTAMANTGAGAKTKTTKTASALSVEVVNSTSYDQVVVHGDIKEGDYKVSRYNSPDRIVVDIFSQPGVGNRSYDTSDSQFLYKVRVGNHADKSRIVLDLTEKEKLAYDAKVHGGDLVVTVARPGDLQTALNVNLEYSNPVVAQVRDSSLNDTAAVRAAFDQNLVKDTTVAANPGAINSGLGSATANGLANTVGSDFEARPKMVGLSIEPTEANDNSVVINMNSSGAYTLKRTAPSEYVVTLEGAALDSAFEPTVVSPQGNGQIRSARSVVQGNDVLVRIFTAPKSSLTASNRGNKIVVASSGLAGFADDSRAQFAPEAGEKAAGAAKNPGEGAAPIKSPADLKLEPKGDGAAVAEKTGPPSVGAEGALPPDEDELSSLLAEQPKFTGRLISLDLQDTDIDNALRIIAEVSNLNIIASDEVQGKVTLRLIDVPWDQALDVILKSNNLDKVREGSVIRIAPVDKLKSERESLKQAQQAEEELEALTVKYIRISYAKAAELKPLVETVISERGTVTYDERTNQLIVKDIGKGIKNVAQLIAKLDLRTPQVLLETQIVEAQRSLLRNMGSELGFQFVQSPATGNATGYNFPNSIAVGGGLPNNVATNFAAPIDVDKGGSAINFLLGSADGTASINARISALESEGRVRIVSRPAVATTNNKQAIIKSVEKIRVKTPSGGLSVATGAGATANGATGVATETIEIGITLEVTPQASPDYFVLLDINAKSSTFGSRVVDGIPSEVERSANSSVLVSSGQTFAMGGIYKITDQDTVDGVPFLKDVPFLGTLFRRSRVDNSDEELIFFLTPRIIEGSFDDAAMRVAS